MLSGGFFFWKWKEAKTVLNEFDSLQFQLAYYCKLTGEL